MNYKRPPIIHANYSVGISKGNFDNSFPVDSCSIYCWYICILRWKVSDCENVKNTHQWELFAIQSQTFSVTRKNKGVTLRVNLLCSLWLATRCKGGLVYLDNLTSYACGNIYVPSRATPSGRGQSIFSRIKMLLSNRSVRNKQ